MREALLALLVKEPAHGYHLRRQLAGALGPAGEALNPGQVYVTLSRLLKAGLVAVSPQERASQPDRKVYSLTASGRERVAEWLTELDWPRAAPVAFHLKLVAAAATGMADPVGLIGAQRRELLRQLRDVQAAARGEPASGPAALLLEGAALRLQADIRWLELCERHWIQEGQGGSA